MHILYFHQHFSTPAGAAGTRSYEMAKHLLAKGHSVTMVCGSYGVGKTGLTGQFVGGRRTGVVEGIKVIEFDLSYSNKLGFIARSLVFLKFALSSIKVALFEPCDLVFATSTPLTAGIPGIAAKWVRRKPFVFEVRDLWPELPKEMGVITNPLALALLSLLEWICYRSADRCVGLSPGIVEGIARRGVRNDHIALVANGCDIGLFGTARGNEWRPEGVSRNALMAVFTGTHGTANGLDAVLDAAKILIRRGRDDIKFVLVGDGKCKPDLVARATREKLDNVIFLGPVEKFRLAGLLASADVGIQCLANVPAFYYGTSPNKFFDYLAAGLPVINNYPGWVANLIEKFGCGIVVPPEHPAILANAFERAADDRQALEKMERATLLAAAKFDRTILADQWVDWVVNARAVATD